MTDTQISYNEVDEDYDDEELDLDPWEPGEYGYVDANFIGTDTWEDQAGMKELKDYLKIPDTWILVKVVNFNYVKLQEMQTWLEENCTSAFRRVGWSSGCSTKVGIAFENPNEAYFYKLRWR